MEYVCVVNVVITIKKRLLMINLLIVQKLSQVRSHSDKHDQNEHVKQL